MSPGYAGFGRQRTPGLGQLPAAGKVTRLPRAELEEPAITTTTPTAIGTARENAGCCISIFASATPSGNAAIPNTVQTKKYPTPTSQQTKAVPTVPSTACR